MPVQREISTLSIVLQSHFLLSYLLSFCSNNRNHLFYKILTFSLLLSAYDISSFGDHFLNLFTWQNPAIGPRVVTSVNPPLTSHVALDLLLPGCHCSSYHVVLSYSPMSDTTSTSPLDCHFLKGEAQDLPILLPQ